MRNATALVHGTTIALLMLTGCATKQVGSKGAIVAYRGEMRPLSEVALVNTTEPFYIQNCSGMSISSGDMEGLRKTAVAILPGHMEADVFFSVSRTDGAPNGPYQVHSHYKSPLTRVIADVLPGHTYFIFNSWLLPGQTQSIPSAELWGECVFGNTTIPMAGSTTFQPNFTLNGKPVSLVLTVLDMTTADDIQRAIAGSSDWRIRRDAAGLCEDKAFLEKRRNIETNTAVVGAIDLKLKSLTLPSWMRAPYTQPPE